MGLDRRSHQLELLYILAVHTTCGCTTDGGWDRRVEPSKTGRIAVQFDSSRAEGLVSKTLTVVCNDPQQSNVLLSFEALVWKPIEVSPALVWMLPFPSCRASLLLVLDCPVVQRPPTSEPHGQNRRSFPLDILDEPD